MDVPALGERLRATAARAPDAVAFVEGPRSVTYGEWDEASDRGAGVLRDAGVAAGDVVLIMLSSGFAFARACLAVAKLGAVAAALNPRLAGPEVSRLTELTGARIGVADRQLPTVTIPPTALDHGRALSGREVEPTSSVAIVFTSGTTGSPKGATFTHQALDAVARAESEMGHEPHPVRLQAVPMAAVQFMARIAWTIDRAATTVTLPRWNARAALEAIARDRVTSFGAVPAQLELMLRAHATTSVDTSSLRWCTLGGAPAPAALIRRAREQLGVPVLVRYSCTEVPLIAGTRLGDSDEVAEQTVGHPLPGVEVVIDDPGPDGVGEVLAHSPAMMSGYWGEQPHHGPFGTGDLGAVGPDGTLRVVGRRKEMYIRGGYNVYPAEVEQALRAHPRVRDAAVVGIPDDVLGERGKAVVVARDLADAPGAEELQRFVGELLADYKVPDVIELRDELPLDAAFKVDKRALREG